jgi:hypothetical protein
MFDSNFIQNDFKYWTDGSMFAFMFFMLAGQHCRDPCEW